MATTKAAAKPVVIKQVLGTDGADLLVNSSAKEAIIGGGGIDKVIFDEGTRGISVNLATGVVVDSFGVKDSISGVEIVIGTSFNDRIVGSDNTDYLAGGAGNDYLSGGLGQDELYGGEGNDSLYGGDGSDFLVGGKGFDLLNGGAGFDTADYSDEGGAGISVDLQAGTAIDNYGDTDKLVSIERVKATDFEDKLLGNGSANMFEAGGGNDYVDGRGGMDTLLGGFGDDTLLGGSGDDVLVGGRGSDQLDGGTGKDTVDYSQDGGWRAIGVNLLTGFAEDSWGDTDTLKLIENVTGGALGDWIHGNKSANVLIGGGGDDTLTGGGGNDIFRFHTDHGHDRIIDFNAGDKLDLTALGFSSLDQVVAAAQGHDLGALIVTGESSSILLVDVNIASIATSDYFLF